MKMLLIAAILFITACAGSPMHIAQNPLDYSDGDLVEATHWNKSPAIMEEIKRRNFIPENEWRLINRGTIEIGMSRLGTVLALGLPLSSNRSANADGTQEQWVYGRGMYVYLEGDNVTAWQN